MPAPSYLLTAADTANQSWNKDPAGTKKDRDPSWCVAIVRFKIPGAMFTGTGVTADTSLVLAERPLMVIENDCVAVSVSNAKASMPKMASVTMKPGEIWYPNACAPGDWIFIWMADEQTHINQVVNTLFGSAGGSEVTTLIANSKTQTALNGWMSGLKFMGRVTEIPHSDNIASMGQRNLTQTITCQAFTELASSIYYTFVAQGILTLDNTVRAEAAATNFYQKELAALGPSLNPASSAAGSAPISGTTNGLERTLTNLSQAFLNFWRPTDGNDQLITTSPEKIIGLLFMLTMGVDPSKVNLFDPDQPNSNAANTIPGAKGVFGDAISIPRSVASIMNRKSAKKLWQIYNVYLGLQTYENLHAKHPWQRFAPKFGNINADGNFVAQPGTSNAVFYGTPYRCKGFVPFLVPPIWDNQSFWNIYSQFLNPVVNEMYTCLRANVEGKILPTLVVREKPFSTGLFNYLLQKAPTFTPTTGDNTSESKGVGQLRKQMTSDQSDQIAKHDQVYDQLAKVSPELTRRTMFGNLPRWTVDESVLLSIDISPSESRRINFVQVWGRSTGSEFLKLDVDQEILKQVQLQVPNYVADDRDMQRHGLRADITETNFDVVSGKNGTITDILARQRADWLFNGHLKLAGTVTLQGVQAPIVEGDNLQVRGLLFHIDAVQHTAALGPDGKKTFRTVVSVSNGMIAASLDKGQHIPAYAVGDAYYEYTKSLDARNNHPGFTDVQNTGSRKNRDFRGETVKKSDNSDSGGQDGGST
jgi:hypothetical protein